MLGYLLKILFFLVYSFVILYFYYFVYTVHLVSFDGYIFYTIFLIIFYASYKIYQLYISKEKAYFSVFSLVGYFLLNLFVLCLTFFSLNGQSSLSDSIGFFFNIILQTIFPVLIVLISLGFGNFILSKIKNSLDFSYSTTCLLGITLGLISFISLLVIFGIFGLFNLFIVFLILSLFLYFGFKDLKLFYSELLSYKIELDIKEGSYLKLFVTEFFYIVSYIVLGIALIFVFRPFPIGWDDLGVYMNYPNLIAQSNDLLSLGGMYAWQTFTAVGYLFGSNVPAFYMNLIGLFLSFIGLNIIFSKLLSPTNNNFLTKIFNKSEKTFLPLPIMLSTLFISLPMVVFQTQKDLKVDEGLFFITIVGLFLLIKYIIFNKTETKNRKSLVYIFILGIIAGFSFSVKFTALLYIVSIIGVLSFFRLSVLGFFGYVLIFFSAFTYLDLWSMMNVVINPNNIKNFEILFSFYSFLIGSGLLIYSSFKNLFNFKIYLKEVGLFLAGVIIILSPWIGKNISEIYPNISVGGIISGYSDSYRMDLESIYSTGEISEIRDFYLEKRKSEKDNSITTNEDFLRYFGYENGIIDFVYMPWNLTMQKNQGGEFTDIGFLFLALIPTVFLFLNYRNKYLFSFFIFVIIFQLLLFIKPSKDPFDLNNISSISSESLSGIYEENNYVFKESKFHNDIFDIDFSSYITDDLIHNSLKQTSIDEKINEKLNELVNQELNVLINNGVITTEEELNSHKAIIIKKYLDNQEYYYKSIYDEEFYDFKLEVVKQFYNELTNKIKSNNITKNLDLLPGIPLIEKDFGTLKLLSDTYNNTAIFSANDLKGLEKTIENNNLSDKDKKLLIETWKENRSFNGIINDILSKIGLPYGYFILFLLFIIPLVYLFYSLDKKDKHNEVFLINLVFSVLYVFLWLISAFGIVWYGITMYFSFLLMIGLGVYNIVSYKENDNETIYLYKMVGSIAFLSVFVIYFFNSVIPNNFNNLKNASYLEFKNSSITQESAIYLYHPDYLNILFELNIADDKKTEFIKTYVSDLFFDKYKDLELRDISYVVNVLRTEKSNDNLSNLAGRNLNTLYKNITNPEKKFRNQKKIYRIGTFLKYYISENNKRILEDSLIFNFNDYIYSDDTSETIERLRVLGLDYLLVDLNAATIDQSLTRDLTFRFEKLLKTFTSNELELIETDSVCLKLGLDIYRKNNELNEFLSISGVNYESYDENLKPIYRTEKKNICANYIKDKIDNNEVDENNYSYLLNIKNKLENEESYTSSDIANMIKLSYKALFKIK